MNKIEELIRGLENIGSLCNLLACAMDECEFTVFSIEDISGCLHHLHDSLDSIIEKFEKEG